MGKLFADQRVYGVKSQISLKVSPYPRLIWQHNAEDVRLVLLLSASALIGRKLRLVKIKRGH